LSRKVKKIYTCCSVWHAYADAFVRVSCIMIRKPETMTKEERFAINAFRNIVNYEHWHKYSYSKDSDAVNYRRAYCDALRLYNRINAIKSKSDAVMEYCALSYEERQLMSAFVSILLYACDKRNKIGHFNRVKVYNFTKTLNAATNFKNHTKK